MGHLENSEFMAMTHLVAYEELGPRSAYHRD